MSTYFPAEQPDPPSSAAAQLPGYPTGTPPIHIPGQRASMGARFGGLVIDTLIIGAIVALIGFPTGLISRHRNDSCNSHGVCVTTHSYVLGGKGIALSLLLGIVYSAVFVGLMTQTLGHRVARIRVVNADTGEPIGTVRGGLRWLVMCVTGAIFTLGYWSPYFDSERRRGWHDQASNPIAISAS